MIAPVLPRSNSTRLATGVALRAGVAAILLCGFVWLPAQAAKRVGLVIGNSEYLHTPKLSNPKNDAAIMAAVLTELGVQVIERHDLTKSAMERIVRDFGKALDGADVGVLFYAGHGLQVAGQNYLVPIDAELASEAALDFEMIRLDLVQRTMERSAKSNILFFDACRDNPLAHNLARAMGTRSNMIARGFAPVESGLGTLISYSTQPGNVALDGSGRNSPFTEALVKRIKSAASSEDLSRILINVRNDVYTDTKHRQVPWEHSALFVPFYFVEQAAPQAPVEYTREFELAFWNFVKDKSPELLKTYIEKHPDGHFVPAARVRLEELKKEKSSPQASSDSKLLTTAMQSSSYKLQIKSKMDGSFTYKLSEVKDLEHVLPAAADCSALGKAYAAQLPRDAGRDNTRFWVRIGSGDIGYCQRIESSKWHVEYYNRDVQDGLVVLQEK